MNFFSKKKENRAKEEAVPFKRPGEPPDLLPRKQQATKLAASGVGVARPRIPIRRPLEPRRYEPRPRPISSSSNLRKQNEKLTKSTSALNQVGVAAQRRPKSIDNLFSRQEGRCQNPAKMKSLKAIFRRQKEPHPHQDDLSRTSSISNLNADAKPKNQGAFAKVRKSQSKDKLNENGQKLDKKGCNKNNNQIDARAEDLGLQEQLEAMAGEKAELVLQLGDNRNQLGILQTEITRLKMFHEQSAAQVEQLTDENAALRNKLRDVVHSPLSDNEKQMLLLDSQRHHSSAPASIAANALGDGDLTACSTPDWDKQSSSNVSEISVACLQDKINQMQETHYSTNEELQATLQELTDLQRQLTEVQQDNERLMEEKNLMFQSLCRQTERLNGARNEIDSLKHLLCKENDDAGQYESVVEREQKLVELLKGAQEEREKLLLKQEQMSNEISERNAILHQKETEALQLSERVRTLESSLDAKHAEHKQMDVEVTKAKDSASSRQIEIDRLRDLLENARTKIVELEQDRALSDKSELDDLLDNARKEKDALESEVANLKEQVARGRNESEKLREQVSILQEECKVLRNNGKCLQSELEYKVEKLTAEKANVTEQLQHLEEAANELQVQAQCQLEDKRQLSSVLSETQRNMSEVERKNLEYEAELRDLKRLRDEENDEWQKFQNDLLTSVRVANDFKTEAQQELQKLVMENKGHRDKIRSLEAQLEKLKADVEEFMRRKQGEASEVLDVEAECSKIDKSVPYELLNPRQKFLLKLRDSLEQEKDYKKAIRFTSRIPVAISKPLLDSVYKNPSLKSIAESNEYLNLEDFGQEKPLKASRLTRSMNDLNASDIEFLHQTLAQRDSNMSTYQDSILFGNSVEVPPDYIYEGTLSVADLNIEELIANVAPETPEEEKLLQQMHKEMAKIGRKNTLKKKVLDRRKVFISSPSLDSVLKDEKLAKILRDPTIMDAQKKQPLKSKLKRLTRYQDISCRTNTANDFNAVEDNLRSLEVLPSIPTPTHLELPPETAKNEEEEDQKSQLSSDSKVYSYCFATGAVNVEAPQISNSKIQLFVNTEPPPRIFKAEERKSFTSFGKEVLGASNRSSTISDNSNRKTFFSTFGKSREDLSSVGKTEEENCRSSKNLDKAIDPLYAITNSFSVNEEKKVKNEDGASTENEDQREVVGGAANHTEPSSANIPTFKLPPNYRDLKKESKDVDDIAFKFSEAIGGVSSEDDPFNYNEDAFDSRTTSDFDSVEAFKDQSDFGQNSSDDEMQSKNSIRNPLFWSMDASEVRIEDNKPQLEENSKVGSKGDCEVAVRSIVDLEVGTGLLKLEDNNRYKEGFFDEDDCEEDVKLLKSQQSEAKFVINVAAEKTPEEEIDLTSSTVRRSKKVAAEKMVRKSLLDGDEQSLEELLEGSSILRPRSKGPKFSNFGARRSKHIEKTKAFFEQKQVDVFETSNIDDSRAQIGDIFDGTDRKKSKVEDSTEAGTDLVVSSSKNEQKVVGKEGLVQSETVDKVEDTQPGKPHYHIRTSLKNNFGEFEKHSLNGTDIPEGLTPKHTFFEQDNQFYESTRRFGIRCEDNFGEAAYKARNMTFVEENLGKISAEHEVEETLECIDESDTNLTEEELRLVRFARSVSREENEELTDEDKHLIQYARRQSTLLEETVPEDFRQRAIEDKHLRIFHDMIETSDEVTVEEFEEFRGHYKDVVSSLKKRFHQNEDEETNKFVRKNDVEDVEDGLRFNIDNVGDMEDESEVSKRFQEEESVDDCGEVVQSGSQEEENDEVSRWLPKEEAVNDRGEVVQKTSQEDEIEDESEVSKLLQKEENVHECGEVVQKRLQEEESVDYGGEVVQKKLQEEEGANDCGEVDQKRLQEEEGVDHCGEVVQKRSQEDEIEDNSEVSKLLEEEEIVYECGEVVQKRLQEEESVDYGGEVVQKKLQEEEGADDCGEVERKRLQVEESVDDCGEVVQKKLQKEKTVDHRDEVVQKRLQEEETVDNCGEVLQKRSQEEKIEVSKWLQNEETAGKAEENCGEVAEDLGDCRKFSASFEDIVKVCERFEDNLRVSGGQVEVPIEDLRLQRKGFKKLGEAVYANLADLRSKRQRYSKEFQTNLRMEVEGLRLGKGGGNDEEFVQDKRVDEVEDVYANMKELRSSVISRDNLRMGEGVRLDEGDGTNKEVMRVEDKKIDEVEDVYANNLKMREGVRLYEGEGSVEGLYEVEDIYANLKELRSSKSFMLRDDGDNLRTEGGLRLRYGPNGLVEDNKFDEVRSSNEVILRRLKWKSPMPLPRASQIETSQVSKSVKKNSHLAKMENMSGMTEIPSESKKSSGAIPKARPSNPEPTQIEENSEDFPSATSQQSNRQSMENLYESPSSSEGNIPHSTQPQPSDSYLEIFKKPEDKVFENLSPVKEKREYFTFTVNTPPEKPTSEPRQSSDKVSALKKRFEDNKENALECGPTFHNLKNPTPLVRKDAKQIESVSEIKIQEQNLDVDDEDNSRNGAEMRAKKDNLDIGNSRESFEMAKKMFENKGK